MKPFLILALLHCGIMIHAQKITIPSLQQPPATATELAPGIISTTLRERDFALSPNGNELFYTLQAPIGGFQVIIQMEKDAKGNWSKPAVAKFSGQYVDLEPAFSPDGKKLFFSSNRPLLGKAAKDFDIWYMEKKEGQWGEPMNAGPEVNSKGNEFYPSVASNGNLYYTATYNEATSKEDIYVSMWKGGKFQSPEILGEAINTITYEFNAFVSPDESFIIFSSYGRKDDHGRGDLYMSMKDAAGKWQPARNLSSLNSDRLDYCPFVSFDKKAFFFTSERAAVGTGYIDRPATLDELLKEYNGLRNGNGNIYWVSWNEVMKVYAEAGEGN